MGAHLRFQASRFGVLLFLLLGTAYTASSHHSYTPAPEHGRNSLVLFWFLSLAMLTIYKYTLQETQSAYCECAINIRVTVQMAKSIQIQSLLSKTNFI